MAGGVPEGVQEVSGAGVPLPGLPQRCLVGAGGGVSVWVCGAGVRAGVLMCAPQSGEACDGGQWFGMGDMNEMYIA